MYHGMTLTKTKHKSFGNIHKPLSLNFSQVF
jgi:hypothetical protein